MEVMEHFLVKLKELDFGLNFKFPPNVGKLIIYIVFMKEETVS